MAISLNGKLAKFVDFKDNGKGITANSLKTIRYNGNVIYENPYTEDGWDPDLVEESINYLEYTEDDNYVYVTGFKSFANATLTEIYVPSVIHGKQVVLKETELPAYY
jgi:hydroxymethylpyrimidine pyrophosphatase-like HAD family hydrolase